MNCLRRYNAHSEIQKTRALIGKQPIGINTPTMHLHALREEFGNGESIQPLLRQMLQDSLPHNIAPLLDTEHISDLDDYAERADELYIMYPPHDMPEQTKGLPGSTAAKEATTKEVKTEKAEPAIAVITWPEKTMNMTTNNEMQVALAALSGNMQEWAIRFNKSEVKLTVAAVTKTINE